MKLSIQQMMMIGGAGAFLVIYFSMMNWRRAVHAAMIVALIEGAIRKWIFPQGSELVYFLKDIILLGAYIKFFLFPDPDVRAWRVRLPEGLIACVCLGLIAFGAVNANIGSIGLAVYGLKIYLWYVPLGFMMPMLFRNEEEMTRVLFRYAMLAIPICLLGAAQFVAGPGSPLTVYVASANQEMNNLATFGGGIDTVRITGTFSYISGHGVFVQFFFILSLGLLTGIQDKRRWLLLVNLPLLIANGLMAGSRTAVYSMLVAGALIVLVSSVIRLGKGRGAVPYLLIGAAMIILGVNVFFPKALYLFEMRRQITDDKTVDRAVLHPMKALMSAAKEVDMTGFGIGMSHPASEALRRAFKIGAPKRRCPVYDSEPAQVMVELGWPGFMLWYGFRLMVIMQCWGAFRRAPPSMFRSMALGFFLYNLLLLHGSFILNHTANIFGCAAWGFCLISRREPVVRRLGAPMIAAAIPSPSVSSPPAGGRRYQSRTPRGCGVHSVRSSES